MAVFWLLERGSPSAAQYIYNINNVSYLLRDTKCLVFPFFIFSATNCIKSFFPLGRYIIVTFLVVSRDKQIIHLQAVESILLKQSKTTAKYIICFRQSINLTDV